MKYWNTTHLFWRIKRGLSKASCIMKVILIMFIMYFMNSFKAQWPTVRIFDQWCPWNQQQGTISIYRIKRIQIRSRKVSKARYRCISRIALKFCRRCSSTTTELLPNRARYRWSKLSYRSKIWQALPQHDYNSSSNSNFIPNRTQTMKDTIHE